MIWIIPKEEKALEEQFGGQDVTYRNHVLARRFGQKQ